VGKGFSAHRMLLEYSQRFYAPAQSKHESFSADGFALAREMAGYIDKLGKNWGTLAIEDLSTSSEHILKVGDTISIRARVHLAGLSTEDVSVELYWGTLSSQGEIEVGVRLEMSPCGQEGRSAVYCAEVVCETTGRLGYTIRILPKHRALVHPFLPGLVKWG
jgi:starch phosphorylase